MGCGRSDGEIPAGFSGGGRQSLWRSHFRGPVGGARSPASGPSGHRLGSAPAPGHCQPRQRGGSAHLVGGTPGKPTWLSWKRSRNRPPLQAQARTSRGGAHEAPSLKSPTCQDRAAATASAGPGHCGQRARRRRGPDLGGTPWDHLLGCTRISRSAAGGALSPSHTVNVQPPPSGWVATYRGRRRGGIRYRWGITWPVFCTQPLLFRLRPARRSWAAWFSGHPLETPTLA